MSVDSQNIAENLNRNGSFFCKFFSERSSEKFLSAWYFLPDLQPLSLTADNALKNLTFSIE
ncbi:hypothetical protein OfM2_00560 [Lactovum odontotermitis]